MRRDFLPTLQRKVATSALPASPLRGAGHRGVTAAARGFLAELDLGPFGVSTPARFDDRLEGATAALRRALPTGTGSWGVARKALNLFLRDAFYNADLRRRHKLHHAEGCFEVPLDGIVGEHLRARRRGLPPWPGVRGLTPEVSAAYQAAASEVAGEWGLARVHLDMYLWLPRGGAAV